MSDAPFTHPARLSPELREQIRQRSKQIFGNLDRLDVAVAVALSEDGVVNATDLSWSLQIANNRVRAQLLALTELGFLQPDEGGDSRKRQYLRLDDPFWETCLDLYRRWSEGG